MKIGVIKEIKDQENRVALTPAGAQCLVQAGHTVWVQERAGMGSGFTDAAYHEAGACWAMRRLAHEGQKPRFLQRPCVFARALERQQHLVRTAIVYRNPGA